ncbi:hypothetical protein C9374_011432 [Naegleria lovaniensis]|uniref:Uncharacterized protein n=1 Tax=Naegleria lovaniensis TaxID=51637 RepID=A0AA88KQV8_NAELO|nr:uncharacterized protein C9374_011432 [Naegleria lovaniensis]KAG2392707.1 hypothetical protein C9374_011432 [Naegleria lovaniensis]
MPTSFSKEACQKPHLLSTGFSFITTRVFEFLDSDANLISNSILVKSMLGLSTLAAIVSEIYFPIITSVLQLRSESDMISSERNRLRETEILMKRDVIRFLSWNGIVSSGLVAWISSLESPSSFSKIIFMILSAFSPAIISQIIDALGQKQYHTALYSDDESTILPLLNNAKHASTSQWKKLTTFIKTIFTQPSYSLPLLSTAFIPLWPVLISNRLIPQLSFSATSELMIEGYKHQLNEMQDHSTHSNFIQETSSLIQQLQNRDYFYMLLYSYPTGIAAGATIHALYLLGEERGWRDFLWNRLVEIERCKSNRRNTSMSTFEFFKNSLLVGFAHGLFQLPFTLQGQHFGMDNSRWGSLCLLLNSTLLSPILCFLSQKIKHETGYNRDYGIVSSVARGIFQAVGGWSFYFSKLNLHDKSYSNLFVGPLALNTSITLATINLMLLGLMCCDSKYTYSSKLYFK